jgi:iron complex outermembrane recepter protein
MTRTMLSRGASAGALSLALTVAGIAQESLPTIDIGGASTANAGAKPTPAQEAGYSRSTSFGATKTNTPLIDTPVAVQIVPHELIEDQQILSIMEATRNVSGVQASTGTYYDQYLIRGFTSGYGVTYRNGLKMEGMFGSEEIAFTDRVEIVKGPSSVLYGRIEPGGFVNVVTKRPQEQFKAEANTQFGSWGLSRTTVDVTGAVDDAKTVLYRVMGVYDRADSFVDYDHRDNGAASIAVAYRPTNAFEFNAQIEHYQKKQTEPDGSGTIPVNLLYDNNGKPVVISGVNDHPYALPRNFSINDPAVWSDFPHVVHHTTYAFDWSYKFDEAWKVTNRFHYIDYNENLTGLVNWGGFDGVNIYRRFRNSPIQRNIISTNLDLTGRVETGPITHDVLIGVDWYTYSDAWVGARPAFGPGTALGPLNVFWPVTGGLTTTMHYLADTARGNTSWRARQRDFGVYAQDQLSFWDDRVHILLAGRWDRAEEAYPKQFGGPAAPCFPFCTGYPAERYPDSPKISPRAGLLFKLTEDTSVYGSYVRSFGANNSAITADGRISPPEEALQWEIGLKKLWFDGRVTSSVTLFDLTKKNVMEPDPLNPQFSRPAGTVKSRGVELDLAGKLTDNLSVIASYTFDSAKIVDDLGNGNKGHRFNGTAPNVGNLTAKWDTAPGAPEGWEFGGSVYATDERWGSDANIWKMPGFVKFDTMVAYRTPIDGHKVIVRLNVKNLTDRRYFEFSDGSQYAYYGQPRTFIGSVNFQF